MNYDNSFIEKVRAFGVLGYNVSKIIDLVEPEDKDQFIIDFHNENSLVYKAYHKGKTTGQYTLDKALFDQGKNNNIEANDKLYQRQQKEKVDTAINERFKI